MKLFERRVEIDIDLRNRTMQEVMNLPEKHEVGITEYYVDELINPNHLHIRSKRTKPEESGIHDFIYDSEHKKIKIYSRFRTSAFLLYVYVILPFIPFFVTADPINIDSYVLVIAALIISSITIFLVIVIRSDSKEIEREMVLRINYLNGVMN